MLPQKQMEPKQPTWKWIYEKFRRFDVGIVIYTPVTTPFGSTRCDLKTKKLWQTKYVQGDKKRFLCDCKIVRELYLFYSRIKIYIKIVKHTTKSIYETKLNYSKEHRFPHPSMRKPFPVRDSFLTFYYSRLYFKLSEIIRFLGRSEW